MIRRLLPSPLLTLALIVLWLVLNQSVSPGQIILGVVFGVAAPALLAPLRPARPHIRHPLVLLRLILHVGYDVIESNLQVFWSLLRHPSRPVQSSFIHIPLDMRDPHALALLAMILCITPGTAWAEVSRDRSMLLLHVFEIVDADAMIAMVKQRYERPLMEIFE